MEIKKIGELAVTRKLISTSDVEFILCEQKKQRQDNFSIEDTYFGNICEKQGLLDREQLDELLNAQKIINESKWFGRYTITRELGFGGMGVVYEAYDFELKRIVALKTTQKNAFKQKERFKQEATCIAQLDHENIVKIYDYNHNEGINYISMEFVDGYTLTELIQNKPKNKITKNLLLIVKSVTIAMDYAHSKGIIHRDIKPSNIMVDNMGKVKVLDFGLAKSIKENDDITETHIGMGTKNYMSPEQLYCSKNADQISDIYSIGAVIYECIAGFPPFKDQNVSVIKALGTGIEPTPINKIQSEISSVLEMIICKSMAKKREARYQSAKSLLYDLEKYLSDIYISTSSWKFYQFTQYIYINMKKILVFLIFIISIIFYFKYSKIFPKEIKISKPSNFLTPLKLKISNSWTLIDQSKINSLSFTNFIEKSKKEITLIKFKQDKLKYKGTRSFAFRSPSNYQFLKQISINSGLKASLVILIVEDEKKSYIFNGENDIHINKNFKNQIQITIVIYPFDAKTRRKIKKMLENVENNITNRDIKKIVSFH